MGIQYRLHLMLSRFAQLLTLVVCLTSLLVEVTLDSSTPFVREYASQNSNQTPNDLTQLSSSAQCETPTKWGPIFPIPQESNQVAQSKHLYQPPELSIPFRPPIG